MSMRHQFHMDKDKAGALIRRQYLPRQPFAPADPDEVPMRTRRDQVGVED